MAFQYFPGATAVESFYNGVLLASEQIVSFGNFLVNKNTGKTLVLTENVECLCRYGR
jgi:proteasome beta subunit